MNSATSALAGRRIQLLRRADLPRLAVDHHHDAVGQRQRLLLVVRHVDRGAAEHGVDAADLGPHLQPQLGIQVGQRLVHQHQRRLHHDGARDRHALLLAAGQLAGQLVAPASPAAPAPAPRPPAARSRPSADAASPGRSRCSAAPSCAGTARSSGTPCRSRDPPAPARRAAARPARSRRRSPAAARRCSSARWTCRSRTGRAGRRTRPASTVSVTSRSACTWPKSRLIRSSRSSRKSREAIGHAPLLADPRADLLVPALERIDQLVRRQRHLRRHLGDQLVV